MLAFDTGPGNMVIDALVAIRREAEVRSRRPHAATGRVNDKLFGAVARPVRAAPPKSTGREQ